MDRTIKIKMASSSVTPAKRSNDAVESTELAASKKQKLSGAFDAFIIRLVGKDEKRFSIHQSLLCAASPFFVAACKPEWMKPDKRVIKFPADDPEAMQRFAYWLYNDRIYITTSEQEALCEVKSDSAAMHTALGTIAMLGVMAEKYQVPRLINHVIDFFIDSWDSASGWDMAPDLLNFIYVNTVSKSKLRRFHIRAATCDWAIDEWQAFEDDLDPKIYFDAMIEQMLFTEDKARETIAEKYCHHFHVHKPAFPKAQTCKKLIPVRVLNDDRL